MLKNIILMAVLFSGQPFLNAQSEEVRKQGVKFIAMYLIGEPLEIRENWFLEDEENVNVEALLQMQSDVFGLIQPPTGHYYFEETLNFSDKTTTARIGIDSLFWDDLPAELTCYFLKGKKKKDRFKITEIKIESGEGSSNTFAESLCEPYIQQLKRGAVDSIAIDALNMDKPRPGLDEESAKRVAAVYEPVKVYLMEALEKVDPSQPIEFHSCTIKANTKGTLLETKFSCTSKEGEAYFVLLKFVLNEGEYDLTGAGSATANAPMNLERF